jgi:hypothetical protein
MKGIWKARIQKKPWIEGSEECASCVRRFLLEPCRDRCHVIVAYAQRHGLLFLKSTDPGFVLSLSDPIDVSRRSRQAKPERSDSL